MYERRTDKDRKARGAKNGSNIIDSRNWSNKKLVCFSNYSLLGSPLWLVSSRNRLIIIINIGQKIKSLPSTKIFSFSRFHARIGPKSQGKGIHVWWNANWGTFSKKMQIYSPPTFIYPEKKSDAKTIFFRNHNDILLHWNLFYDNCAFDLVRFESELEFASHNNISTNFQRSLILLSIQLHNRTEKLPTLNVTAFFAIFNSLSNNRVTSTRRKQHLELWHSTSIFTQILGGERVATILRRLATVWWSESYWQFGLNTRNCLFSIEFPNKRLAPSKRFDKGKNKSKNWI